MMRSKRRTSKGSKRLTKETTTTGSGTPLTSVGDGSAIYLGPTDHTSILGAKRRRRYKDILDEIRKVRRESVSRMHT